MPHDGDQTDGCTTDRERDKPDVFARACDEPDGPCDLHYEAPGTEPGPSIWRFANRVVADLDPAGRECRERGGIRQDIKRVNAARPHQCGARHDTPQPKKDPPGTSHVGANSATGDDNPCDQRYTSKRKEPTEVNNKHGAD